MFARGKECSVVTFVLVLFDVQICGTTKFRHAHGALRSSTKVNFHKDFKMRRNGGFI